jgi:hypothetical protein
MKQKTKDLTEQKSWTDNRMLTEYTTFQDKQQCKRQQEFNRTVNNETQQQET